MDSTTNSHTLRSRAQKDSTTTAKSKSSSKNSTNESEQYWWIHDKPYDLTPFFDKHPGGPDVLYLTKGRDVTETFESVHALSRKDIPSMLKQYEVPNASHLVNPKHPNAKRFTFNDDGTYAEIKRRVREMFPTQASYKATTRWWFTAIGLLVSYALTVCFGLYKGYMVSVIIAGALVPIIGFHGCLHDASHSAISTNWKVNKWLYLVISNIVMWDYATWWQHHCYAHHSFTGDPVQDPDLRNGTQVLRKHPYFKLHRMHRFQKYFMYFLYLLLPNQMVGQIIEYWRGNQRKKVFGIKLSDYNEEFRSSFETAVVYAIRISSVVVHLVAPFIFLSPARAFFLIWLFWTTAGSLYFLIVAPNHDTDNIDFDMSDDWADQQIQHSNNFSLSNPLLTTLFGGMNCQIEHHLFCTVNNTHLPRIAKVVREVCAERGIKYNHYDSLIEAHMAVNRNYARLGEISGVKE